MGGTGGQGGDGGKKYLTNNHAAQGASGQKGNRGSYGEYYIQKLIRPPLTYLVSGDCLLIKNPLDMQASFEFAEI